MIARLKTPPTAPDTAEPLMLTVTMEPDDESAPLRVLSLLARRRCRVRRASFALGDGADGAVMRLELDAPPGRETTVVRWLSALVPVRRVERDAP